MIEIKHATLDEYRTLVRFHYRGGEPATRNMAGGMLRACVDGALAGVLVVSMPTLNGGWRDLAWPGRYTAGPKRELARLINAELRCISRVVVDPRFRARGVATALVRAYLAEPITRCTEAVAAMGAACPFFERAGMAAYRPPPSAKDQRLADALTHLDIDPTDLIVAERAAALCERHPLLVRELRVWAGSGKTDRAIARAEPARLAARAAGAALFPTTRYAHTAAAPSTKGPTTCR